jgi:S-ribosylhomocysteine lyase LuxS involved in autoinducer biosynthesis
MEEDKILEIGYIYKNSITEPFINIKLVKRIGNVLFTRLELKLITQNEKSFESNANHSLLHCLNMGFDKRFKSRNDLHFLGIHPNGSNTGFIINMMNDNPDIEIRNIYDIVSDEFIIIIRLINELKNIPFKTKVDCSDPNSHISIDEVKNILNKFEYKLPLIITEDN